MSHSDQDGFTLLETLVSFVILSAAIIGAFEISASSLRALQHSQTKSKAMIVIRAQVQNLVAADTVKVGAYSGTTDGMAWRVEISQLSSQQDSKSLEPLFLLKAYDSSNQPLIETILRASQIP